MNYTNIHSSKGTLKVNNISHPDYKDCFLDWDLYRDILIGGRPFRTKYLTRLSKRESETEFNERRKFTPIPGHAKTALFEVRNALYERFVDIKRTGGTDRYQRAVKGENLGVDGNGSPMNKFMGTKVSPELLAMGKVAVVVDAPNQYNSTKSDSEKLAPYMFIYPAERIKSWNYEDGELVSVLLQEESVVADEVTGLVVNNQTRFILYKKVTVGVELRVYDEVGTELEDEYQILDLSRIPVVIGNIETSLLCDIAYHQVALLNLGSLDMSYARQANFPFYLEQYDYMAEAANNRVAGSAFTEAPMGTDENANQGKAAEVEVGVTKGRRYGKGLDAPSFIHPSSEPLLASMKKQEEIRMEIRQLVLLSVANLNPNSQSQESKEWDNQGLYAGLAFLGLTMQHMEQEIAKIYADFESSNEIAKITYPDKYSIRSDKDRREEGEGLLTILPKIPSKTFQRITARKAALVLVGNDATERELSSIMDEIDNAEVLAVDPDVIRSDVEANLVDPRTASVARLYPEGSAEKAEKAHAERVERIAASQQKGTGTVLKNPAARGVDDLSTDPNEASDEKKKASNPDLNDTSSKRQRGKQKGEKQDGTK